MAWIFQGNPDVFDLDDYLARYPELIYWRTPRFKDQISIGDLAFIWRAGNNAGVVAVGEVVEEPVPRDQVKHPEALGDDLWQKNLPDPKESKVGIKLIDVRLTVEEGMVERSDVKNHPATANSTIIRMPNSTVFNLDVIGSSAIEAMWGGLPAAVASIAPFAADEGELRLRAHWRRERSPLLAKRKIEAFIAQHGVLHCEICGANSSGYPSSCADRIFEVHHTAPLASAVTPIRTTLDGLAVLCACCHRAVHASKNVESNFISLLAHFGAKNS